MNRHYKRKLSKELQKKAFRKEQLVSDSDLDDIRNRLKSIENPKEYAEALFNAIFDKMYQEAEKLYVEPEESGGSEFED